MAVPSLTPASQLSAIVLPSNGTYANVASSLPFGIYSRDTNFLSGAVDQVSFTYRMLGGDVLDIELTEQNVYAAYEAAVLEYSYLINIHQSKNVLPSVLGNLTGTFDQDGELKAGQLSSSLNGSRIELKLPKFDYGYIRQVSRKMGEEAGVGGDNTYYSSSVTMVANQQEYDLQDAINSAVGGAWAGSVNGKKISIRRVYYKTPRAMWNFYGYYGGIGVVGNLSTYGQYADDSTFEIIPTWHNKLQAMAYEDSIYTRTSHYSYEIRNNKIKIYPGPVGTVGGEARKLWFEFTIPQDNAFEIGEGPNGTSTSATRTGVGGINNMNTLPFSNIPFENINSIGKAWIRKFSLSLSKEILGQIRSKFSVVPIPGESITLNGENLLSQAKEEQNNLREELKTILSEQTYDRLAQTTAEIEENAQKVLDKIPLSIYTG